MSIIDFAKQKILVLIYISTLEIIERLESGNPRTKDNIFCFYYRSYYICAVFTKRNVTLWHEISPDKAATLSGLALQRNIIISSFHAETKHYLQCFLFWHLNVHLVKLLMLGLQL